MTSTMSAFAQVGHEIDAISVFISYDIIRLFSEGLYKSPHKAIEELVSNSYDAGAGRVHVLLPDPQNGDTPLSPLWVIDDGHGMNADGFHQLWRVADSDKTDAISIQWASSHWAIRHRKARRLRSCMASHAPQSCPRSFPLDSDGF